MGQRHSMRAESELAILRGGVSLGGAMEDLNKLLQPRLREIKSLTILTCRNFPSGFIWLDYI
jgi:hypothetical protein